MFILFLILFQILTFAKNNPNILFVLADDFGWGNVGYHNPTVSTPNIDYLVKNGLELNRHYTHYICAPSRSSLHSGRLPPHVNLQENSFQSSETAGIPVNYTCMAEKIKSANYYTAFIGKWDAGATLIEQTPLFRGYDSFYGYLGHVNDYWNKTIKLIDPNACPNDIIADLWHNTGPAYNETYPGVYLESILASKVLYHLDDAKKNSNNPFFIFYGPHIAHHILEVPKEYYIKQDNDESICQNMSWNGNTHTEIYPGFNTSSDNWHCRSILQSMIGYLDAIIGNITNKLKQNGQWDNTLIVFVADNGGNVILEQSAGNNYPLRGGKHSPLEGMHFIYITCFDCQI